MEICNFKYCAVAKIVFFGWNFSFGCAFTMKLLLVLSIPYKVTVISSVSRHGNS